MFKKLIIFFALLTSFQTYADKILVDNVIVNFDNNKRMKEDIFIRNISDKNTYVKVIVTEIINAGQVDQEKIEHRNPKKSGIFVSPNKLILKPNGTVDDHQAIRIANINGNLTTDRIYRIQVIPVINDFEKKEDTLGVKILMGYEILTLIQPNKPIMKYDYKIKGNNFIFNNLGNSNILLHKGKQCDSNNENCKDIKTKRIYANSSYNFNLPYENNVVEFYLKFGEKNKLENFK
jgi:hypothetical protein